ncbi:MAG: molecular chaperone HtpG [Clostridia bacterium]|nr:molecular chaperone HtpG [Clostridia bacterium]
MKKNGQIEVDSQNIFPIIKKWLYSDKDIFLREIVSNACDAISKLAHLNLMGELDKEPDKARIDIRVNKDEKTLIVSDNGIGMTAAEVEDYITKIAFSGAADFIEKYKDKTDGDCGIIGHFGLGFYSVFMVSDKVEIETLSYQNNEKPVHWTSDGSYTYEIEDGQRTQAGTSIILHINDESAEFLDENKIRQMLNKYCQFMPYEIYLNSEGKDDEKPVNNTNPLWLKAPKDCTKQEYEDFYREIFTDFNAPLFWIHLNVDFPFRLKGILYFPKQSNRVEVMPGQVKLYNNQVYIADNIKEVIPEFLMLLKGVIDCPDLPLNVSRSFLQNDRDVQKISKHITKKVSDKLHSIFKQNREDFEKYWEDIAPFIKFGCIKEENFYDRVKDIILLKTINGQYETLQEFKDENNGKFFYVTDENLQSQYIDIFKDNNMNAAVLSHAIDAHFISFLEYKDNEFKFSRIDSSVDEALKSTDSEDESSYENLVQSFKTAIDDDKTTIEAQNLKSKNTPAIIIIPEFERRMKEMGSMYGDMFKNQPVSETLVINTANDIVKKIDTLNEEDKNIVCKYIYNLAKLNNKKLTAEEISEFTKRSTDILQLIFDK